MSRARLPYELSDNCIEPLAPLVVIPSLDEASLPSQRLAAQSVGTQGKGPPYAWTYN